MTEQKDLLLINEQLRRWNRFWKALAMAACAVLVLVAFFSVVAASRAKWQALEAKRRAPRSGGRSYRREGGESGAAEVMPSRCHPTPLTDSIDSSSISWSHNNLGRRFLEV